MGRRNPATPETRLQKRARLVAELRLFGHRESADLLERDGGAIVRLEELLKKEED